MLALHGFDAYGLEISADAVTAAEAYSASEVAVCTQLLFGEQGQPRDPRWSDLFSRRLLQSS